MLVRGIFGFGSGIVALVAQTTFSSTIGLGSVMVAMLVVVLFGVFSLRDKRNGGWKDLYEQEREKCGNLTDDLAKERNVRHDIKDELAATNAKLLVEEAKPNMAAILEDQRKLWSESMAPLTSTLQAMQKTQEQMLMLLTSQK